MGFRGFTAWLVSHVENGGLAFAYFGWKGRKDSPHGRCNERLPHSPRRHLVISTIDQPSTRNNTNAQSFAQVSGVYVHRRDSTDTCAIVFSDGLLRPTRRQPEGGRKEPR